MAVKRYALFLEFQRLLNPQNSYMNEQAPIAIKDTLANPAPLGLFGFGMTTVLLNLHNAGCFEMNSMILAMGLFYGGIAQVIAGIFEYKKNNTFGMTAFISYGFFWLTLVALIFMGKWGWVSAASGSAMVAYLVLWGVFTLLLFFGTLKLNRALQFVFASLTILFFLLALGDATQNPSITHFAGYEGIICGASAIYAGAANLLNEVYGRVVLPLGAR
jgi:succinate-acetate transporter protein